MFMLRIYISRAQNYTVLFHIAEEAEVQTNLFSLFLYCIHIRHVTSNHIKILIHIMEMLHIKAHSVTCCVHIIQVK